MCRRNIYDEPALVTKEKIDLSMASQPIENSWLDERHVSKHLFASPCINKQSTETYMLRVKGLKMNKFTMSVKQIWQQSNQEHIKFCIIVIY